MFIKLYFQKNVEENCLEVHDENPILPINKKKKLFLFQLCVRECVCVLVFCNQMAKQQYRITVQTSHFIHKQKFDSGM